jgi:hypothetical protein
MALSRIFKVRGEDPDTAAIAVLFSFQTVSPARGFHGTRTLMQKRKLFPDLPTASPGPFLTYLVALYLLNRSYLS